MPQLAGVAEIAAALERGEPRVTAILVERDCASEDVRALVARAEARGVRVHPSSPNELWRLARPDPAPPLLALVGRDPGLGADAVFERGGAKWLVVGVEYPGNTGAAIRTADVTGADAVFVDSALDHTGRRRALRTSMGADRFLPVHWESADRVVERARANAHRVLVLENRDGTSPWKVDLTGPVLLVVGGEERGVPEPLVSTADAVIEIPMAGFIPSYNLQAAVAAVGVERLRQIEVAGSAAPRA